FATANLSTTGNATNLSSIINEEEQIIKAGTYHPSLKQCCCNFFCTRKSAYCCDSSNDVS
ncbi:MAG: hypothetical protein WC932_05290, partial [archaeon]